MSPRGVALAMVGALLALVVGASPAAAHDTLTGTTPDAGATVDRTPSAVVLTFDQPVVAMGTQVLVTGPAGEVHAGVPRLVDDTVTQDLQGGAPAGAYTVVWRVTSSAGHPVSGTFTFTSGAAGTGLDPPADPQVTDPMVATGVPGTTVLVAVVGVLVLLAVVAVVVTVLVRRRSVEP